MTTKTNGQKTGADFQTLIRVSSEAIDGLLLVETSPPYTMIRNLSGGQFVGRHRGKGPTDYVGFYGSRAVFCEAKSTRGKSFTFADLPEHQAKLMRAAHRAGNIGFLFVEFAALTDSQGKPAPRYFALPWPAVEPCWIGFRTVNGAPASIPLKTFERDGVEVKREGARLNLADLFAQL